MVTRGGLGGCCACNGGTGQLQQVVAWLHGAEEWWARQLLFVEWDAWELGMTASLGTRRGSWMGVSCDWEQELS